jgi:hypothetical protein
MTYRQTVTNDEGEPLGVETIYDDPPDPDDWYELEDDSLYDDWCCGPHEWGCCTRCCETQTVCYPEEVT